MRRLAIALTTGLTLAYPLLFYFALDRISPRALALGALALVALRLSLVAPERAVAFARVFAPASAGLAAGFALSAFWNHPLALLLTPALGSFALLGSFAASFARAETSIETLALAQVGSLPADERAYCRRLNGVWCAFFAANGGIALGLALADARAAWALWTGALSYAALGALFGGEYLYRHWRFRRYVGAPTDRWLRRVFPPRVPPSR